MFPDVTTFLACKEFKNKFVLISDSQVNGNFMIQHFLVQALKSTRLFVSLTWPDYFSQGGSMVYLVSFGQLLVHYSTIASKLGVNVSKCVSTGQLHFVDCLTKLFNNDTMPDSADPLKSFKLDQKDMSLRPLYEALKIEVEAQTAKGNTCSIVIDDYSILLSLGVTLSHLVDFIHYLRVMLCTDTTNGGPLVVMTHCDEDMDEDEDGRLLRDHLAHVCHMHISATGLKTGHSKDVHGELKVQRYEDDSAQILQFKVTDRNVHLFAKGTSSAVL